MNWVDYISLFLFLGGLFVGWRMGLLGAVFNAIGIYVGIFIATNFSQLIAGWFTERGSGESVATVLAYVVIIVGVFVGAQVARGIAKRVLSFVLLGWVDSLGSVAVGLLLGFALSGAFLLGLARFSSDLPQEGLAGMIVETTGFRGNIQDSMVESTLVPTFIDVTDSLPASAFVLFRVTIWTSLTSSSF